MATKTFEELKQMAIQIRDEKTNKQNTATRIGTQMLEHLTKLEQDFLDKDTTEGKFSELSNKTAGVNYLTCETAASTAAKTVSITGLTSLTTGIRLLVKMANNNTASNATLNINSLGAKPLYYDNERTSSDNSWEAGEVIDIYYDGANFYSSNVQGGSSDGGNKILEWKSDAATTRKQVILKERKAGLQISYKPTDSDWVNEQYIGTSFTDTEWIKDVNWRKIAAEEYVDSNILDILNYSNGGAIEITKYLNAGYGYVISEAVGAVASPTISNDGNYSCLSIKCKYGNKLKITGTGGQGAPLYCVLDKDKNVLLKASSNLSVENEEITMPEDTDTLYINFNLQSNPDVYAELSNFEELSYRYDILKNSFDFAAYTNEGLIVAGIANPGNILSDFIEIDDDIIGVSIFTSTSNTGLYVIYFDSKKAIMLNDSIKGDNNVLKKTILREEMPTEAAFFRIVLRNVGFPEAYVYRKSPTEEYIDLRDIYSSVPGIVQSDGTILNVTDSIENYAHIIIPISEWKNISLKIATSLAGIYPIAMFLRSKEINDISSIATMSYPITSGISYGKDIATAFISDDDIPKDAKYLLVNYHTPYFYNKASFVRAERRDGANDFGRRNLIYKSESRTSRYLRIEVTTDDDLNTWPEDKTDHTASVKIYDENNLLISQEDGVTLSYQGSSTMAYPKKNFRIKFNDKKKFGDFPETKKYNLKAYYLDKSQIREPLVYAISNQVALSNPNIMSRYPFSDQTVFPTGAKGNCIMIPGELHINGEFWGLYHFGLAKDGNNMLIDENNPLHFAFEPAVANNASVWTSADSWEPTVHDEVPEDMKQKLQDWIDYLNSATSDTLRSEASEHLDVNAWIDYLIVQHAVFGWDGMSNNMVIATYDGGNTFTVYGYDHDNTFGFMNNAQANALSYANTFTYRSLAPTWIKNFVKAIQSEINKRFKDLYDSGILTYQNICNLAYEESRYIPYSSYEANTEKWPYPGDYTDYTIKDILDWYKDRVWYLKWFFRYYE